MSQRGQVVSRGAEAKERHENKENNRKEATRSDDLTNRVKTNGVCVFWGIAISNVCEVYVNRTHFESKWAN